MSTFAEYQENLAAYDDDMFIGRLVWYSVPTTVRVGYEELCKAIITTFGPFGVDMPLPRAPEPHNVFKRACKSVGKLKRDDYITDPQSGDKQDVTNRYLIHDAGSDAYGIYRELVKEVLDRDGHKLSHETLGKYTYMRVARNVAVDTYDGISPEDRDMFLTIGRTITDYYNLNRAAVTSDGVRYFILKCLHSLMRSYTARSSGGVYFVNKDNAKYLAPLAEMLSGITNDAGTERVQFHSLPLMDDESQREMLRFAFQADVTQRLQEITDQIVPILNGKDGKGEPKQISAKKFGTLNAEFKDAKALIEEQQTLLQDGLDTASTAMKVLNTQMVKLLGRVKS